jgi:hypothetical protein
MTPRPLIILALLLGAAIAQAAPTFEALPGHRVADYCNLFAVAAEGQLQAQGIPCRRVIYVWTNGTKIGWHAIILWREGGKTWAADNWSAKPKCVTASTEFGMIKQFDALAVRQTELVGTDSNKAGMIGVTF